MVTTLTSDAAEALPSLDPSLLLLRGSVAATVSVSPKVKEPLEHQPTILIAFNDLGVPAVQALHRAATWALHQALTDAFAQQADRRRSDSGESASSHVGLPAGRAV